MTNPGLLLDACVATLRSMADLVQDEMLGDESLIVAYKESYPQQTSLLTAIKSAQRPSIIVAYMGMVPGNFASNEVDKHKISLYLTTREVAVGEYGYVDLFTKIVEGVPGAGDVSFRYTTIHENCFPPEKIQLKRIVDEVDLWEMSFFLTEIGG